MTVREKFEARFNRVGNTQQVGAMTEAMFEIYMAGRESMRAEAKAACEIVKERMGGDDNCACDGCQDEIGDLP